MLGRESAVLATSATNSLKEKSQPKLAGLERTHFALRWKIRRLLEKAFGDQQNLFGVGIGFHSTKRTGAVVLRFFGG